jgi:hypothetical protein
MKQIVVIDAGWVLLGDVDEHPDRIIINNASVVRVWGTTKGLGELALTGPTCNTILDPCGRAVVLRHAIKFLLDCTYVD